MSEGRAARLERLLQVQAKKRQMEEWQLAELTRRERHLDEENAAILQSLGDESLLHGLFLEAKSNALRRNDVEAAAIRARQDEVRARLREARAAEKRLERAAEEAGRAERAVLERKSLEATLDDFLSNRLASFE